MSQAPNPQPIMLDLLDNDQEKGLGAALQGKMIEQRNGEISFNTGPTFWMKSPEEMKQQQRNWMAGIRSRNGRIAWITAQTIQADDAVRRLTAMNPDKTIIRIYSYNAEVYNLMSSEPELQPQ
ncbi:hypothetical protein TARUN_5440 [Trichoderma arundinaceum]|uniref:Uncharacterized protein n=1 Tax=Trichoderma arundinaceum TaxID=490622 RepID=A0A395NLE9_TRIAR|nr:hypothetical protein TARUN_5440 [Trichoderma arundinaceum]